MYYMCKRERDSIIFTRIKEWESDKVKNAVNKEERDRYIGQLEQERKEVA